MTFYYTLFPVSSFPFLFIELFMPAYRSVYSIFSFTHIRTSSIDALTVQTHKRTIICTDLTTTVATAKSTNWSFLLKSKELVELFVL